MNTPLYPLTFTPVYKDYLWGGTRIPELYRRAFTGSACAESWEISDRADGLSVVSHGPLRGTSLAQLLASRDREIVGKPSARFPLLIKLIDARERLSIQVHPDDATAARFGGEAKTECWYILDAGPGAAVYAGFHEGVTESTLRTALDSQTTEQLVRRIPVARGDLIYMPGGRVHAIGEGCLILEAQQNSNTTYRLYDWGRRGPDGRPRELHIAEALKVIRWQDDQPLKIPASATRHGTAARSTLIDCPFFRVETLLPGRQPFNAATPGHFSVIFVAAGQGHIEGNGVETPLAPGVTCLVPACLDHAELSPHGAGMHLIRIGPGNGNGDGA